MSEAVKKTPLAGARLGSFVWLLPAFFMIPVFLIAALNEEANLPNAFQSLATSAVLWFPCLALLAVAQGKFRAVHATIATLLFAAYDSFRVREVVYGHLDPVIGFGGNPNWITLGVMIGAVSCLTIATALRPTMFRVVVLVASAAQITTLILFHVLTVTQPIGVAREIEREFVQEYTKASGGLAALCGIQGRICFQGEPLELAERLEADILTPDSVVRLLRDEAESSEVLFTWTESAFAATADEAMRHITVAKTSRDEALVLINQDAPTKAFSQMKMAFSILAGAFQQTWMMLSLLILWRHGDYRLSWRGWRRLK